MLIQRANPTCALAVISSLSWLVKFEAASIGSFSQGSNRPELPIIIINN